MSHWRRQLGRNWYSAKALVNSGAYLPTYLEETADPYADEIEYCQDHDRPDRCHCSDAVACWRCRPLPDSFCSGFCDCQRSKWCAWTDYQSKASGFRRAAGPAGPTGARLAAQTTTPVSLAAGCRGPGPSTSVAAAPLATGSTARTATPPPPTRSLRGLATPRIPGGRSTSVSTPDNQLGAIKAGTEAKLPPFRPSAARRPIAWQAPARFRTRSRSRSTTWLATCAEHRRRGLAITGGARLSVSDLKSNQLPDPAGTYKVLLAGSFRAMKSHGTESYASVRFRAMVRS